MAFSKRCQKLPPNSAAATSLSPTKARSLLYKSTANERHPNKLTECVESTSQQICMGHLIKSVFTDDATFQMLWQLCKQHQIKLQEMSQTTNNVKTPQHSFGNEKKKAFPKAHTQLQAVYINQILTAADQDTTLRSLLPRRKQKMLCATLPGSRRLPTSGSSYQGDTLVCETIIIKHPSPGFYFTTPSFGEGGDEKERKEQSLFLNSNSTTYFPFLLLISNTSK